MNGNTSKIGEGAGGLTGAIHVSVEGARNYLWAQITFRESILGMPGLSLSEDGSFVGVNNRIQPQFERL